MLGKLVAVSFAVMVTALLVTSMDTEIAKEKIPIIVHAQTTLEENNSISEPYTVYENLSDENKSRINDIGFAILQLKLQNDNLTQFSTNELIQDMIKDNNEEVDRLLAELDVLWPDVPVVEISAEDEAKMNAVLPKLAASGLPLIEMGINWSTGLFDVVVDIDRTTPDIEQKIREIAVGVEVDITYDKNTAVLQSNCNRQSCDNITQENYTERNIATHAIDLFPFIQFDSETEMWGINYYSFLFYASNSITVLIFILIGIVVFLCARLLYRYMRK